MSALALALALGGCATAEHQLPPPTSAPAPPPPATSTPAGAPVDVHSPPLPGMPPVSDPHNVYSDAGANMLNDVTKAAKPLVYVPHTKSGDVWVIDPVTFAVVGKYPAGIEVQHVVPSHDMRMLYATDDLGNTVTPFDPNTGKPDKRIPVIDPYNMYYTPDGSAAIVVAEARKRLIWYNPKTWKQESETLTPNCAGIDHADYTPNGRIGVFTCEFDGRVAVVDLQTRTLLRTIDMPKRNRHMGPQDIKLAPDGSVFYIADSDQNGLWVLDGAATKVIKEIPTGPGAHGLYLDREAKRLFVTNRHEGTVSVLDAYTGAPMTKWKIPGHASPDMGGLSADGKQLWLSGRYNDAVYVLSTDDGHLIKQIPVGKGPHGLCVWPQTGRYSLGHTGITR
ncbi:YncE family protein [Pseudonocardia spinosispora]|uniref:YncE family protein n=1 Tax=Pseudonocardia spinosispora TaxID=103441 RepID=UPI0003F5D149|nr:beta-propeller fold lactonase family protein [Pseudonocardia spinosispora]